MKQIKIKYIITIFLSSIILFTTLVNAKVAEDYEFKVANLNIEAKKDLLQVESISNDNIGYEKYASKTNVIKVTVKAKEEIKNTKFNINNIKVKVGDKYISNFNFKVTEIYNENQCYVIELYNISGDGNLVLEILEGAAFNNENIKNEKLIIDTDVTIDNSKLGYAFSQIKLEDGRVKAQINFFEGMRPIEGWDISGDGLAAAKIFASNTEYLLPVSDYAGNTFNVEVSITRVTI